MLSILLLTYAVCVLRFEPSLNVKLACKEKRVQPYTFGLQTHLTELTPTLGKSKQIRRGMILDNVTRNKTLDGRRMRTITIEKEPKHLLVTSEIFDALPCSSLVYGYCLSRGARKSLPQDERAQ